MAAPFILITSTPGDTDIVSQFPTLDRNDKGIIQTWINTDHNVDGTHSKSTYVQVGVTLSDSVTVVATPAPTSNRTAIYRDTDGALKTIRGEDSTVEFLGGVPPGTVVGYAGTTIPQGWLKCDGRSAGISRTTFARLFAAIGILYGAGDLSTTFNLPDLQGRVIIGLDGASRVTAAGGNFDANAVAASGGVQNKTLLAANIPVLTFVGTPVTPIFSGTSSHLSASGTGSSLLTGSGGTIPQTAPTGTIAAITPAGTVNAGSPSTPVPLVQPSLVLNYIIRT